MGHLAHHLCWAVGTLFVVYPFARYSLQKERRKSARILTGCFGLLLFASLTGFQGLSSVRGEIDAAKVDDLCDSYSVGDPFDADEFRERARERGVPSAGSLSSAGARWPMLSSFSGFCGCARSGLRMAASPRCQRSPTLPSTVSAASSFLCAVACSPRAGKIHEPDHRGTRLRCT